MLRMNDVIAIINLELVNAATRYFINYIDNFNKLFKPNIEDHITL